jgi:hypothetical protein
MEVESVDPVAPNQDNPRLRVAHLAPFAPDPGSAELPEGTAVTVTIAPIGSTPVLTIPDVRFADSTAYYPVLTGTYLVRIWPAGESTPVLTESVTLAEDTDYSAIAIGGANEWDLELLLLEDDNSPPTGSTPGLGKVRIGHLAPFAAGTGALADVWVNDVRLLDDVPYKAYTGYYELPSGKYKLELTPGDATVRVFGPSYLMLEPDDVVSVFAVGDLDYHDVAIFVWPSGEPGFLLYDNFLFLPIIMRGTSLTAMLPPGR